MESSSLQQIVDGFGEFPNAVFDFTEQKYDLEGVQLTVRAYRDAAALAKLTPLPMSDPIVLKLTWDELRAIPGASDLEAAVRSASWGIMTTNPKLLRGTPPLNAGDPDTRHNIFAGGTLVEV
jgi:hypothetical protein